MGRGGICGAAPVLAALAFFVSPGVGLASGNDGTQGLAKFHAALAAYEDGTRKRPVSILHLGDSHIALDNLTGEMRKLWSARNGNAGQGLQPGVPYKYYSVQGYRLSMSGDWEVASSLPANAKGPFGIQGFRASAARANAEMVLDADEPFDGVEVEVAGAPDTGYLSLTIDNTASLRLSTYRKTPGLVTLYVPAAHAHHLRLAPVGNGGPVRVLGWGVRRKGGVRYDSYGVVAARLGVVSHWRDPIVDAQIERRKPDLIILGYGTNEGFDDGLNLTSYRKRLATLIERLKKLAPDASIAVLGAFDGARDHGPGEPCGDGWVTPPKLTGVRDIQRDVATKEGVWFWDGEAAMGGRCAIENWVTQDPPRAWSDHVHLRPLGARQMGEKLWQALMSGTD